MAVDDIYQLSIDQVVHDVVCSNVWTAKQTVDGTGPLSDNERLIKLALEVLVVNMHNQMAPQWEAFCVRVQRIAPTLNSVTAEIPVADNVGVNGTMAMPANQVAVCTFYSDEFNRLGRGRKFWSGLSDDKEFANNLTNDGLIANQALGNPMTDELEHISSGAKWRFGNWDSIGLTFYHFQKIEARSVLRKLRGRTTRVCRGS